MLGDRQSVHKSGGFSSIAVSYGFNLVIASITTSSGHRLRCIRAGNMRWPMRHAHMLIWKAARPWASWRLYHERRGCLGHRWCARHRRRHSAASCDKRRVVRGTSTLDASKSSRMPRSRRLTVSIPCSANFLRSKAFDCCSSRSAQSPGNRSDGYPIRNPSNFRPSCGSRSRAYSSTASRPGFCVRQQRRPQHTGSLPALWRQTLA